MTSVQIGGRVRYWRLRRGLDRKQFADRVGRSTSWLDKIETGERALLRLPMLETVAEALGVTVEALTDPAEAQRAVRSPDAAEVAAIRGALGRYGIIFGAPIPVADNPRLGDLRKQLDYVDAAFLSSNFSSIGRHLPKLIAEAQRATQLDEIDHLTATRVLVKTYRVASSTLLKLGANETAWLAADCAILAASYVQDPYCLARATRSVARAMTSLGQTAEALDALLAVARRLEPGIADAPNETAALYGMVLLAAEISAAKLGDGSRHYARGGRAARQPSLQRGVRFGDGVRHYQRQAAPRGGVRSARSRWQSAGLRTQHRGGTTRRIAAGTAIYW